MSVHLAIGICGFVLCLVLAWIINLAYELRDEQRASIETLRQILEQGERREAGRWDVKGDRERD